ncbi:MAG TPA: type II secretion system F family protein [Gemmatimonadaceae bacterium]|jgi:tight adherence protein B|nr:type II secretion system F family protein [Gemmatimonadaceae bacterium]
MTSPTLVASGVALGVLLLLVGGYLWADRRWFADERALRERLAELAGDQRETRDSILRQHDSANAGRWSRLRLAVADSSLVATLSGRAARRRRVEQQLPDAVEMLANALRAGYSLPASLGFVGAELPEPIGPAFVRFHDEQRLGIDTRQALDNLQQRLGTADARLLVLAITVQRETGGNLSELLARLGHLVRERMAFRAQVEVLTAEARASAKILAALPIGLFLLLQVMNPEYVRDLTSTGSGRLMLLYAAVSLTVGFVWLRRLTRIEI